MTDFRKYFKFPLQMDDYCNIKVFTNDHKMAFDWCINLPIETKQTIINKINGTENAKIIDKEFWYEDCFIYCKQTYYNGEIITFKMLRVRGWGMLTGIGGHNIPPTVALKIQNDFAEHCVNMLNN